jgi:hypothetical protein
MMKVIEKPHTYDYNKDGFVPPVCNTCGLVSGSDVCIDKIKFVSRAISGKKLKTLLWNIFTDQDIDRNTRRQLMNQVKGARYDTPNELANVIVEESQKQNIEIDVYLVLEDIGNIISASK